MIKKEDFVAQLEQGAAIYGAFPVTSAILRYVAEELKRGDPPWWKKTVKAWEKREFYGWTEAWGLLLSSIHFEALSNAKSPLVPFFPSCGGTPEADPATAVAKFLADPPETFFEHLKSWHGRYHSPATASIWPIAAAMFFQPRDLPYYVVEINAGAGLNLIADQLYNFRAGRFDSDFISARIGLDPLPLMMQDIVHRRWATAGFFPDDKAAAIQNFDRSVDFLKQKQSADPNFVQLVECRAELGPKFIAKNIPADDPEVGLLVYQVMTASRMNDEQQQAFSKDMWEMMRPWADRALWLEIETVRGEAFSTTIQARVSRSSEGVLRSHDMARLNFRTNQLELDGKALGKFLAPSAAKTK